MRDKNHYICSIVMTSFILISSMARAQECEIVESYDDGSYLVQINDRRYRAITEKQQQEILMNKLALEILRAESVAKDTLLAAYREVHAQYETTLVHQREYIREQDALTGNYRKLVKDLKRLKGEPWLTVSGGIGATGSDTEPAVLGGLGILRLRVWGFLQKDNFGFIVGTTLPLN